MSAYGLKQFEDVQKKIESISKEIRGISFNGGDEEAKKFKLHRLAGREEALEWVLGRRII